MGVDRAQFITPLRLLSGTWRCGLTIHPHAEPKPVTQGIPFLGFLVYSDYRRLKRRKGIAFQRRFKRKIRAYRAGQISKAELDAVVRGWVNHVRYGNTAGLRRALLSRTVVGKKENSEQITDNVKPTKRN